MCYKVRSSTSALLSLSVCPSVCFKTEFLTVFPPYDVLWQLMTAYDSFWQLMTAFDSLWQLLRTFDTCPLCKLSSSQDFGVGLVLPVDLPYFCPHLCNSLHCLLAFWQLCDMWSMIMSGSLISLAALRVSHSDKRIDKICTANDQLKNLLTFASLNLNAFPR